MNKPYLIQRVKRRNQEFNSSEGIDFNFQMDYMGSAEFEFGALPNSLNEIIEKLKSYNVVTVNSFKDFKDRSLRIFCPKDFDVQKYIEYLKDISDRKLRLKERINLKTLMTGVDEYWSSKGPMSEEEFNKIYNILWDLDNHVWFTFNKHAMNQIVISINNVADKRKK